jgi:hypothetical protein
MDRHFIHTGIIQKIKRGEFISDRMSYITLRGCWCDLIYLNVHSSSGNRSVDMKDSFYKELEQVFDQLLKYYMKILLGKLGEKIFSNKKSGMRVYMKLIMIMGLE